MDVCDEISLLIDRKVEERKESKKGKAEWKRKRCRIRITFGIKINLDHVVW